MDQRNRNIHHLQKHFLVQEPNLKRRATDYFTISFLFSLLNFITGFFFFFILDQIKTPSNFSKMLEVENKNQIMKGFHNSITGGNYCRTICKKLLLHLKKSHRSRSPGKKASADWLKSWHFCYSSGSM